jgi:hypothetical protein
MRRLVAMITFAGGLAILPAASAPGSVGGVKVGAASPGQWRAIASGASVPKFLAVSALSSRDVWAVGGTGKEPAITPVAAHWDGRSLHVLKPFPSSKGVLTGVAAVAPDDVWAVGRLGRKPLVAHWNGRGWHQVRTPPLGDGSLSDVAATSGRDVWIVGDQRVKITVSDPADAGVIARPLVLHWNGKRWEAQRVAALVAECPWLENAAGLVSWAWACETYLTGIDASSPRDVWALGTEEAVDVAGDQSAFLRSNGHAWTSFKTPRTKEGFLDGLDARDVAVPSPQEAWTLEAFVEEPNFGRYRLIHWQAGKAHPFEYRTPGASVSGLAAISSTSVWIVGTRWSTDGSTARGPLIIHWNGRSAVRQHTTLDSLRYATLAGVSALSPTELWAAGDHILARYSR